MAMSLVRSQAQGHLANVLRARMPRVRVLFRMATPVMDDERPVVDDDTFMGNVREALVNGYDRCCAHCGIGTAGDGMDMHETKCPEFRPWQ